ncbi:hypothetical protein EUZ93_02445 [Wolbachia pipientis]|nr:hypothetical protein [Wolbachia pipientis]
MKAKGLLPDAIVLPCKSFEARVAKRKQEEENALKAEGLLSNAPYKNVEASSPENQPAKEGNGQSWGAWALQKKSEIGGVVAAAGWLTYAATNVGRNYW